MPRLRRYCNPGCSAAARVVGSWSGDEAPHHPLL